MNHTELVDEARRAGATVLETPAAIVIVLSRAADTDGELVPLESAAKIAATSVRVLRDAVRAGEIAAFGRQRDRAVKRADLDAWIASRSMGVTRVEDAHEARIEARMRRRAR